MESAWANALRSMDNLRKELSRSVRVTKAKMDELPIINFDICVVEGCSNQKVPDDVFCEDCFSTLRRCLYCEREKPLKHLFCDRCACKIKSKRVSRGMSSVMSREKRNKYREELP